ncbi:hypothetical protein ACS0TY_025460 [Phlomoides rotata]
MCWLNAKRSLERGRNEMNSTVNGRVESHHAALKMMLGNSLGSFEHNWTNTHTLYGANHNVIKHSFEKSVNVAQHKFKPIIYKEIRGIVSVVALEILFDDVKRIESGESDPLNCKHYLRQRKLDMPPMLRDEVDADVAEDMDNRLDEIVESLRS